MTSKREHKKKPCATGNKNKKPGCGRQAVKRKTAIKKNTVVSQRKIKLTMSNINNVDKKKTKFSEQNKIDKMSKAYTNSNKQVKNDKLLKQARSNLTSKLNAINSQRRELVRDEKEKTQLLAALLAQEERKSPAANIQLQPPPSVINVINETKNVKYNNELDGTDGDDSDNVFNAPLSDHTQNECESLNTPYNFGNQVTQRTTNEAFESPLGANNRFSVISNPNSDDGNIFDTPEGRRRLKSSIATSGKLIKSYLSKFSQKSERKYLDLSNTGLRIVNNSFHLGTSKVEFMDDYIIIGEKHYSVTPGLLELIFYKQPDKKLITSDDQDAYKRILIDTSAHKKFYSDQQYIAASRGSKYKSYIAPLFGKESVSAHASETDREERAEVSGSGADVEYVHWHDPNALIER